MININFFDIESYLSKKRIFEIDILKTTAIILLIFYHIPIYCNFDFSNNYLIPFIISRFGILGISLFFFISGYSLLLNNKISNLNSISKFFKKRLVRIYPLYWVCLVLVIYSYHLSLFEIIIYTLGFQSLFYPEFIDLLVYHFITAILIYYIIFPIIAYYSKNYYHFVLALIIPLILLILIKITFNFSDNMIFRYYLLFICGILFCKINMHSILKNISINPFFLILVLLVVNILNYFIQTEILCEFNFSLLNISIVEICLNNILDLLNILIILYLSIYFVKKKGLIFFRIITGISFSTYSIFLFSMPIFNFISKMGSLYFHLVGIEMLFLLILFIPIIILFSFLMQLFENIFVSKIFNLKPNFATNKK